MIKVFDENLNYVGFLDNFVSFQCSAKYADIGNFIIKAKISDQTQKLLKVGYCVQYGDFAGRIETIQTADEDIAAKGNDLLGLLETRLIWGNIYYKGKSEDFLRKIVNENAIIPVDERRIIPFLKLGELANLPQITERNTNHESLLEECKKVCAVADYGFRIRLDAANKAGYFEVYEGEDRTAGKPHQAALGKDFDNVLAQDYTKSVQNESTTCLIASESLTTSVGEEAVGLNRKEVLLQSAKMLEGLTEDQYRNALQAEGRAKLKKPVECFDIDIYNVSLSVGDKVSVIDKKMGIRFDARVSERQITIQNGEITTTYLLGEDITAREI